MGHGHIVPAVVTMNIDMSDIPTSARRSRGGLLEGQNENEMSPSNNLIQASKRQGTRPGRLLRVDSGRLSNDRQPRCRGKLGEGTPR